MNTRINTLLASESINTAGTKVIDIDSSAPMSQIIVRAKGTNNGSTPTAHPAKMVSLIELVDGSDVLFSLSGIEAQALNFYEEGVMPFNTLEYEDNVQCCATYHLNFGRYVFDKDLAFDPSKFNNPQLKITHNKASGGSAPDAGTLAVYSKDFDEQSVNPGGFLSSKEHYSYTLSASGHEYIELPTDRVIRKCMVQTLSAGYNYNTNIGTISLLENNGQKTPLNSQSVTELLKMQSPSTEVIERFGGLGTGSGVNYYIAPTYEAETTAVGRSASQSTLIAAQPAGGREAVTNDSSEGFLARTTGYCPHGGLEILNCDPLDIGSWYDVTGKRNVKLDITAGSGASGTAQIVLQSLRNY